MRKFSHVIFGLLCIIPVIYGTVAVVDSFYAKLINKHYSNATRKIEYAMAVRRPEAISVN
jgi:hypothetical protein